MNYDYDLAVIGAGTAGIAAALAADKLAAKVALIEANKVGGENIWGSGIATRTLTRSAKVFDLVQRAEEFGVHMEKPRIVWNAIQLRIADMRDEVRTKQRTRLKASKVQQLTGHASFIDEHTLEIAGVGKITANSFIIATGANPAVPENLAEAGAIAPERLLARKTLPRTLVFIGGGATTCELAQAFKRLGAAVTILHAGDRLLPEEDSAISETLETLFRNEGIEIHLQARILAAGPGDPRKWVEFETPAGPGKVEAGELVAADTRIPNLDGLNLKAAGVSVENGTVSVDNLFRTNVPHIRVVGAASGIGRSNHEAEYQGETAAHSALMGAKMPMSKLPVPCRVTFTDPEIAHLGLTKSAAEAEHGTVTVLQVPHKSLDRAIIEGETSGFAQVVITEDEKILGVHIIGHAASEVIAAFVPAVHHGVQLGDFLNYIYPNPTFGEISQSLADKLPN